MFAEYIRTFLGFKDLNHLFISSFSALEKENSSFLHILKSLIRALILR